MSCSNCFNGCADTISDQCVKYTGIAIPGLNINTGDPLLVVENNIISKILEIMNGEGIIPIIVPGDLCAIVSSYLPVSGPISLNDVISATFKSICNINGRLLTTEGKIAALNADYVIDCLVGVTPASDTHEVVQATINKVCLVEDDLASLEAELHANYVLISDIDSYIATYISSIPASTFYNGKMIPYVAVPFFGVISGNFDVTGAGIGPWEKVYLCNGQNFTPDLRGRTLLGATTMGNTAFDPAVDPGIAGNPTYALNTTSGANQGYLTNPTQLPPHNHAITVVVTDPGHFHNQTGQVVAGSNEGSNGNQDPQSGLFPTSPKTTGITVTATSAVVGASEGHNNIQPSIGVNYIIYIP